MIEHSPGTPDQDNRQTGEPLPLVAMGNPWLERSSRLVTPEEPAAPDIQERPQTLLHAMVGNQGIGLTWGQIYRWIVRIWKPLGGSFKRIIRF